MSLEQTKSDTVAATANTSATAAAVATAAPTSFYRRTLPADCVSFDSPEGEQLFRESLQDGGMGAFFKLSAVYQTQAEPSYCGLASLAMVLNSLDVDPLRNWKGSWRWYDDEVLLSCCVPKNRVTTVGVTLEDMSCLVMYLSHCLFGSCSFSSLRCEIVTFLNAVRCVCAGNVQCGRCRCGSRRQAPVAGIAERQHCRSDGERRRARRSLGQVAQRVSRRHSPGDRLVALAALDDIVRSTNVGSNRHRSFLGTIYSKNNMSQKD